MNSTDPPPRSAAKLLHTHMHTDGCTELRGTISLASPTGVGQLNIRQRRPMGPCRVGRISPSLARDSQHFTLFNYSLFPVGKYAYVIVIQLRFLCLYRIQSKYRIE